MPRRPYIAAAGIVLKRRIRTERNCRRAQSCNRWKFRPVLRGRTHESGVSAVGVVIRNDDAVGGRL